MTDAAIALRSRLVFILCFMAGLCEGYDNRSVDDVILAVVPILILALITALPLLKNRPDVSFVNKNA